MQYINMAIQIHISVQCTNRNDEMTSLYPLADMVHGMFRVVHTSVITGIQGHTAQSPFSVA